MGVRLPSEYQEVQYIQCTGYQYINTGVNLSSDNFEVFCRFAITQTTGSYEQTLFSIWTSKYNYWNCLMRNNLDISVYTAAHHTANKRVVIGQMYNITVIRNVDTWSYVFDDDVVTWTYGPTKINDTPLTLCRRADIPNYANSATHARIYDFSVKANGTIVAKYVPCYRKSDNKPGMYDLVSGTFFVNQDTGEDFTVGLDVIDSISPWLVARRRMLMYEAPRTYILVADESGKVPKAKIPVSSGKHIHMEWDTSKYSSNSDAVCIFSFYGQNATFGTGSNGLQESPSCVGNSAVICWNQQISANVVAGGHIDMVAPDNLNMYIGCWNESGYTGASDNRRLIGDFIKIRIT